jgi:hypothetical protein
MAITYPYRDPDPRAQGHLFATKKEHDTWKKAIQARDEALDENDARDPDADYKGETDPDTLTLQDWSFYSQMPQLFSREYDIFDRKPWIGVRATGLTYAAGDLASCDLSQYKPMSGPFASYLAHP